MPEDPGKLSRHLVEVHPMDACAVSGAHGHPGNCHRGKSKGQHKHGLQVPSTWHQTAGEGGQPHQRSASLSHPTVQQLPSRGSPRSGKDGPLQATTEQGQVLAPPVRIRTGSVSVPEALSQGSSAPLRRAAQPLTLSIRALFSGREHSGPGRGAVRSSQPAGGRSGDPPPLPELPRLMAGGELQGPDPQRQSLRSPG